MKCTRIIKLAAIAALTVVLTACGGGGGDGSGGGFAGGWRFSGRLAIDDCNVGADRTFAANWTVNQSGNRIVVDSGSVVMDGETNNENGYDVTAQIGLDSGCTALYAATTNDIDGDSGDAAVAIGIACTGSSLICTVVYGGSITRSGSRNAELDSESMLGIAEAASENFPK